MNGERETQVLIPQPFMGTLIGTGGSKINELRRVSKTHSPLCLTASVLNRVFQLLSTLFLLTV